MSLTVYWYDGTEVRAIHGVGTDYDPGTVAFDWSDDNVPWRYPSGLSASAREALFTADWESGVTIVDLPAGASFRARVIAACDAASGPVVIRLGEGTFHLTSFELAGSSGSQTFAFGIYHAKLRGFLGAGADKTTIQMDPNSMSTAQLAALGAMDIGGSPNQMGLALLQPTGITRVYLAGLTIQAADQQYLPEVQAGLAAKGVIKDQPAPHQGVVIAPNKPATVSYVRFRGAGRACYAAPPFEHANLTSQYGNISIHHCEFDGRRAPDIDPAQPRRCGPLMGNNESSHTVSDSWLHHANLSRYAMNDQNQDTAGPYGVTRTKVEYIGNGNIDPNLNGGVTLGGASGAALCGYESTRSQITFTDPIMSVDNTVVNNSISQHIGLAEVGSIRRQGGRLYVHGGTFRNRAFPILDGYLCLRIYTATYWWQDGVANTVFVYDKAGNRKQPWLVSGAWPPNPATGIGMDGQPVSPETHYLVRNS